MKLYKNKCFKCGNYFQTKVLLDTDKPTCDDCFDKLLKVKSAKKHGDFITPRVNPNLVFTSLWHNGAKIEVYYEKEPLEGQAVSDRIQLIITPEGKGSRGWLMNIADATDIIYGLSKAMSAAIEDGVMPIG
jgi:hypothetical protein